MKEFPVQNEIPEPRKVEPRGIGVLGFVDTPEAKIGGTVTYKADPDESKE